MKFKLRHYQKIWHPPQPPQIRIKGAEVRVKIERQLEDGSVRYAVPVRAVPLVTSGTWSAHAIAATLANPRLEYKGNDLRAYTASGQLVPPREWDRIAMSLKGLDTPDQISALSPEEWLRRSIEHIPASCFVWVDDLEFVWGEYQREYGNPDDGRADDGTLNYFPPFVSPALRLLVMQGFESLAIDSDVIEPRRKTSMLRVICALHAMAGLSPRGAAVAIDKQIQQMRFDSPGPAESTIRDIMDEARALLPNNGNPNEKPQ